MNKKIMLLTILLFSLFIPTFAKAYDTGFVSGDYVSIRSSAGGSAFAKLIYGTPLTITGTSGDYYQVIYDGVNSGYMAKSYVTLYKDITATDANYCNSLKSAGFPESYCPYLTYLHQKHPNWTFSASNTGLDFYTAVGEESDENEIQLSASSTDLLNKYISAYAKSNYVVEGSNWYVPNSTVVAFFMDPRNFLTEKTMFMFQTLSFNSAADNASTVKAVFGSTYLSSDTYVNWFLEGGQTYNVSSLSLATKTVQEIGTSESSINVSGTAGEYTYNGVTYNINGLYNYYNIGAYSSASNPTKAGLVYAGGYGGTKTTFLRPWTSRELAIKGGAAFIANGYISKGQDTLYYEKFNVGPKAAYSKYTNQYMANIMAPYQEGYPIKNSLSKLSLLDNAFNFTIPVYNNMPASTTQATLLNNNSLLSGIYINGSLISGFDDQITSYTFYVQDGTSSVSVTANASVGTSKVTGTGTVNLTSDTTSVTITVTSQAGTSKTYTIKIVKVKDTKSPSDVVGGINVKVNSSNIYDLGIGTLASTLIGAGNGVSPYSTIYVTNASGQKVDNSSTIKTGYKLVINTPAKGSGTYTLSIHGDVNSDGSVTIQDLLRIQKYLLGSIQLGGAEYFAGDATGDGSVNIQDLLRVQKYLLGSASL